MQAAKDYEEMAAELHKHTQLSNMFDCPEAVVSTTEGVSAIKGDLVLVKDVWDASSLVEQQFQVCWASRVMVLYKARLANVFRKGFVANRHNLGVYLHQAQRQLKQQTCVTTSSCH